MKKKKIAYSILSELCVACGTCIKSCPISLALIPGNQFFLIDPDYCIGCGHCAGVCPSEAVQCSEGTLEPVHNPVLEARDLESFFLEKRSVRNYTTQIPSEEQLASILKVGVGTATASNMRTMSYQFLKGEEVQRASSLTASLFMERLDKLKNPLTRFFMKFGSMKSYTRPRFVQFMQEQMEQTIQGNSDRIFFKAPVVCVLTYPKVYRYFGRVDAALAGSNMMMLAKSMGLESCVVGYADKFALSSSKLRKALKVPKNHEVGLVFALGYASEKYFRVPYKAVSV